MTKSQLLVFLRFPQGVCMEEGGRGPHSRRHRPHNRRVHIHKKFEDLTGQRQKCKSSSLKNVLSGIVGTTVINRPLPSSCMEPRLGNLC